MPSFCNSDGPSSDSNSGEYDIHGIRRRSPSLCRCKRHVTKILSLTFNFMRGFPVPSLNKTISNRALPKLIRSQPAPLFLQNLIPGVCRHHLTRHLPHHSTTDKQRVEHQTKAGSLPRKQYPPSKRQAPTDANSTRSACER
jgi:hypothetical protein